MNRFLRLTCFLTDLSLKGADGCPQFQEVVGQGYDSVGGCILVTSNGFFLTCRFPLAFVQLPFESDVTKQLFSPGSPSPFHRSGQQPADEILAQ